MTTGTRFVAHLQGVQRRLLSSAVKWIAADQLRFGEVKRSNAFGSSLMTPLPATERSTSFCLVSAVLAAHAKGRARRGSNVEINIVDVEVRTRVERLSEFSRYVGVALGA